MYEREEVEASPAVVLLVHIFRVQIVLIMSITSTNPLIKRINNYGPGNHIYSIVSANSPSSSQ